MISLIKCFSLLISLRITSSSYATQIASKYGYSMETHSNIETPDGYLLAMHRIPYGKSGPHPKRRDPVLLMHGLFGSSEHFLWIGPERSLGFLLADRGYDVWMGNVRSVSYSKKHVKYSTNDKRFWNFTLHEFAVYDLPTKIDYILAKTGFNSLFYVAHSQGCGIFFIMCAELPEYNNKIRLFSGLSPIAYLNNISHPWLPALFKHEKELTALSEYFGIYDITLGKELYQSIAPFMCSLPLISEICKMIMMIFGGIDYKQIDSRFFPDMLLNAPESISVKQFMHLAHVANADKPIRYNYGEENNLKIYGQVTPPEYDISPVTAPMALYYAQNDWFLSIQNLQRTIDQLPNIVDIYKVPLEEFTHLDFIIAKDIVPLLYNRVLSTMDKYKYKSDIEFINYIRKLRIARNATL